MDYCYEERVILKCIVTIILKWMHKYAVSMADLRGDTLKLLKYDGKMKNYCQAFVNAYCLHVFSDQNDDRIPYEIKQLISMHCFGSIVSF